MAKHTTPMYRAPEMLDTWNNHRIDTQADIWALGCVLYMLCYSRHPFEDSAKLRIINGNYTIPEGDTKYQHFHQLIRESAAAPRHAPRHSASVTAQTKTDRHTYM